MKNQNTQVYSMSNDLTEWSDSKRGLMKNLAKLITFFQVEYAGGSGTSSNALMLAPALVPYSNEVNTDNVPDSTLADSHTVINYYDDIPCIDGVPIYERISGEPIPYFELFKRYRDMKITNSSRSIARLAETTGIPPVDLTILNKIWHWQARVVPFDEQLELERTWKREKAAEQLDGRLAKRSSDLIEMAFCYLEAHEEQLDPKQAIELLKMMVPIARVSHGMSADKPVEAGFGSGGGRSGTGVSVTVNNANGNTATASSVHGMSASEVATKTAKQSEDPAHLAGILNVLNQSGAFERQILEQEAVLEADFEEAP